jgi:hypothetical protein
MKIHQYHLHKEAIVTVVVCFHNYVLDAFLKQLVAVTLVVGFHKCALDAFLTQLVASFSNFKTHSICNITNCSLKFIRKKSGGQEVIVVPPSLLVCCWCHLLLML